jgi:hypothetical protein
MPSEGLSQIVITRKGQDVFKVSTFDRHTVVGTEYVDGKTAIELIEEDLNRLEVIPGAM